MIHVTIFSITDATLKVRMRASSHALRTECEIEIEVVDKRFTVETLNFREQQHGSFVAEPSRALGSQQRGLEFDPYSARSRSVTLDKLRLTLASPFG